MKLTKTFLIVLYLIISSSILSVNARVKFGKSLFRALGDEEDEEEIESPHQDLDSLARANDIITTDLGRKKMTFFIAGMFSEIKFLSNASKAIILSYRDGIDPGEGCRVTDYFRVFRQGVSEQDDQASTNFAQLDPEVQESLNKIENDLGKNSDDLEGITWEFPRRDCKKIVELYHKKIKEYKKSAKTAKHLSEVAQNVLFHGESFEKFHKRFLNSQFLMYKTDRRELEEHLIQQYFDGSRDYRANKNDMITAFSDKKEWTTFLEGFIQDYEHHWAVAEGHKNELKRSEKDLPDCKKLEKGDTWEYFKNQLSKFRNKLVGAYEVLKLGFKCNDGKDMLAKLSLYVAASILISFIASILGGFILKVAVVTFNMFRIAVHLRVASKESQIEAKYERFGKAAGVFLTMILNLIGIF